MKRYEKDAAQRLLEQYLDHVEGQRKTSFRSDRLSVVVLDVMEYHRRVLRVAESEVRPVTLG